MRRHPAPSSRPRPGRWNPGRPTASIRAAIRASYGCHDLRAAAAFLDGVAAQVDLVAVVLRRVVAGGDHHAAVAIQRPHRVGEQRGGQRGRHQEGFEPGGGEDRGRFLGEDIGVVAGVIADDGARPGAGGGLRHGVGQEGGEAGRGAADHHPVHPVGPGAEGRPEAGGAELQGAAEAVRQLLAAGGGAVLGELDQLGQGGGGGGVRVLGGPVAGVAEQREVGIGRRHRNQTIVKAAGSGAGQAIGPVTSCLPSAPDRRNRSLTAKFPDT